jgi:uracil-DNA glycosylase
MFDLVHPDWLPLFESERELLDSLEQQLRKTSHIPASHQILRAFEMSPKHYRVLLIGQDPYPNPDHACGLAFAVPEQTAPLPPSLKNILRELTGDIGPRAVVLGDVARWHAAGVMLLNRHLTTSPHETAGHFNLGWDRFTSAAVKYLADARENMLVSILWGAKAQELKAVLGDVPTIESVHPSPLSAHRGFFGSRPFSACNNALLELGLEPIDWSC